MIEFGGEFMGVIVFIDPDIGSHDGSWFDCAVGHHLENIHYVMGETVSFEECSFLIIFHVEFSSTHLYDTVVDCFICVDYCLEIGILDGEEGARSLVGFVSGSCV